MTDNRHDHLKILKETGKFNLSQEQEDTINILLGDGSLELEEEHEPTLDLPILKRKS